MKPQPLREAAILIMVVLTGRWILATIFPSSSGPKQT